MTCGERSPLRCSVHLYLLVALSGKPAKNQHPRVKVHLGLYARRGRSQQPSNTLLVWFSSGIGHKGELFNICFPVDEKLQQTRISWLLAWDLVGVVVRSSCDISRWPSKDRSTNCHLAAVGFKPAGAETRWGLVRMGLRCHQLIL